MAELAKIPKIESININKMNGILQNFLNTFVSENVNAK